MGRIARAEDLEPVAQLREVAGRGLVAQVVAEEGGIVLVAGHDRVGERERGRDGGRDAVEVVVEEQVPEPERARDVETQAILGVGPGLVQRGQGHVEAGGGELGVARHGRGFARRAHPAEEREAGERRAVSGRRLRPGAAPTTIHRTRNASAGWAEQGMEVLTSTVEWAPAAGAREGAAYHDSVHARGTARGPPPPGRAEQPWRYPRDSFRYLMRCGWSASRPSRSWRTFS